MDPKLDPLNPTQDNKAGSASPDQVKQESPLPQDMALKSALETVLENSLAATNRAINVSVSEHYRTSTDNRAPDPSEILTIILDANAEHDLDRFLDSGLTALKDKEGLTVSDIQETLNKKGLVLNTTSYGGDLIFRFLSGNVIQKAEIFPASRYISKDNPNFSNSLLENTKVALIKDRNFELLGTPLSDGTIAIGEKGLNSTLVQANLSTKFGNITRDNVLRNIILNELEHVYLIEKGLVADKDLPWEGPNIQELIAELPSRKLIGEPQLIARRDNFPQIRDTHEAHEIASDGASLESEPFYIGVLAKQILLAVKNENGQYSFDVSQQTGYQSSHEILLAALETAFEREGALPELTKIIDEYQSETQKILDNVPPQLRVQKWGKLIGESTDRLIQPLSALDIRSLIETYTTIKNQVRAEVERQK